MKIQNSDAITAIINSAKLAQGDTFPTELSSNVVPVIDMTPIKHRFCQVVVAELRTTTSGVTIYTTSTTKEFYITSATLSYTKDATCDVATGQLATTITIGGRTVNFLNLPVISLTASSGVVSLSFPVPIKVDKGSTIAIGNQTFTAGVMVRCATITGYEVDVL